MNDRFHFDKPFDGNELVRREVDIEMINKVLCMLKKIKSKVDRFLGFLDEIPWVFNRMDASPQEVINSLCKVIISILYSILQVQIGTDCFICI